MNEPLVPRRAALLAAGALSGIAGTVVAATALSPVRRHAGAVLDAFARQVAVLDSDDGAGWPLPPIACALDATQEAIRRLAATPATTALDALTKAALLIQAGEDGPTLAELELLDSLARDIAHLVPELRPFIRPLPGAEGEA